MTGFGVSPDILAGIKNVLRRHAVIRAAGIFGSRGRGDHKPHSDIDIVVHAPHMETLELMDLKEELRELPIIFKIDVVHAESCSEPELLRQIARDEKEIYASSEGKA